MRLYIGNLNYTTNLNTVQAALEAYGTIRDARLITDRNTGVSRGFAFIEFHDDQAAHAAIAEANGLILDGRPLVIREAEQRTGPRPDQGTRPSFQRPFVPPSQVVATSQEPEESFPKNKGKRRGPKQHKNRGRGFDYEYDD